METKKTMQFLKPQFWSIPVLSYGTFKKASDVNLTWQNGCKGIHLATQESKDLLMRQAMGSILHPKKADSITKRALGDPKTCSHIVLVANSKASYRGKVMLLLLVWNPKLSS